MCAVRTHNERRRRTPPIKGRALIIIMTPLRRQPCADSPACIFDVARARVVVLHMRARGSAGTKHATQKRQKQPRNWRQQLLLLLVG
eukprot:COSAG06_NODE_1327_length_9855_cov_3.900574_6_plen_87_part_00